MSNRSNKPWLFTPSRICSTSASVATFFQFPIRSVCRGFFSCLSVVLACPVMASTLSKSSDLPSNLATAGSHGSPTKSVTRRIVRSGFVTSDSYRTCRNRSGDRCSLSFAFSPAPRKSHHIRTKPGTPPYLLDSFMDAYTSLGSRRL